MNKAINRLNQVIEDVRTSGRQKDVMDLTSNVLYLMSQNCNLSPVAGNIIKLLPMPNVYLKKVICTFLIRYSENISDFGILTNNSLRKDFTDPNPQVRKLIIKTVCSIPCLRDLALELLPKALRDNSVHVKQTAAVFCPKVVCISGNETSEIIDQLYAMIRDDDPLVVSNVLMSLEEILEPEGGVVINHKMAQYLFKRITSFPEWPLSTVCRILLKYEIRSENEALQFLNILDPLFSTKNPVILISVIDLSFSLIQKFNQNLEKDILQRVEDSLFMVLVTCSPELSNIIIEHIEHLIPKHKDIFSKHYKVFFCRFKDSVGLKVKKLNILQLLIQDSNYSDILENVVTHLTGCELVSKQAVSTFINMLTCNEVVVQQHAEILLQLLTTEDPSLFEQILISLSTFDLEKCGAWKEPIFSAISEHYSKIFSHEGMNALFTMICKYGKEIESAPYILEKIICDKEIIVNNEMLFNYLLITSVKLFILRPAEMQLILGKILQDAVHSKFFIVKTQAVFYNSLLQTDLHLLANTMQSQLINNS